MEHESVSLQTLASIFISRNTGVLMHIFSHCLISQYSLYNVQSSDTDSEFTHCVVYEISSG